MLSLLRPMVRLNLSMKLKKEKEGFASFAVSPQNAKVTVTVEVLS